MGESNLTAEELRERIAELLEGSDLGRSTEWLSKRLGEPSRRIGIVCSHSGRFEKTGARSWRLRRDSLDCPVCGRKMKEYPKNPKWLDVVISEVTKDLPLVGDYVEEKAADAEERLREEIEFRKCSNCGLILTFEKTGTGENR